MAGIELTLNGAEIAIDVPEDMPLLWAIRDIVGLTGTKYGCGIGACGACTVHVEDVATRSCVTPVGEVAGRRVTTIEGIAAVGPRELIEAWLEVDVAQCGYCQAGQLMAAAALLEQTPRPSREEISAAMRGILCRCGTYLRIGRAIELAAGLDNG